MAVREPPRLMVNIAPRTTTTAKNDRTALNIQLHPRESTAPEEWISDGVKLMVLDPNLLLTPTYSDNMNFEHLKKAADAGLVSSVIFKKVFFYDHHCFTDLWKSKQLQVFDADRPKYRQPVPTEAHRQRYIKKTPDWMVKDLKMDFVRLY